MLAVLAVTSLAACGDGSTPAASGAEPSLSAQTPSASATAQGCGVEDAVTAAVADATLTTVTVEGQCTTAVLATKLADGDSAAAKLLCEKAATVAYVGDVNSIRVLGASGDELSQGIKGAGCLP